MNKTLLAIAVGATFLAPGVSLAAPKVYGKFNIGLDSQKDEIGLDFNSGKDAASYNDSSFIKFRDNNNSSRLGVKGDEEVGIGDLKVIYQLEYGINPDGSEGSTFSDRNLFVGLKGGFGTVKFGRYDTPVKEIGAKVDQFNDTVGDITNLMVGETRATNMIQYSSPKFGDMFSFVAAVQPGEGRTATDDAADVEDGIADTVYAALVFETGMFEGSLGYANNEVAGLKFDGSTAGIDILRATAMFKMADLELGALYQTADGIDQDNSSSATLTGGDRSEDSWLLSAGYTLSAWKFKAQYGQTDGDDSDAKRNEIGVGVDYKLSKATVVQLYYVSLEDKDRSKTYAASGSTPALTIVDPKTDTIGAALVFSF